MVLFCPLNMFIMQQPIFLLESQDKGGYGEKIMDVTTSMNDFSEIAARLAAEKQVEKIILVSNKDFGNKIAADIKSCLTTNYNNFKDIEVEVRENNE